MKWLWLALGVILMTPAFASADYYRYETENGSTAFTDDARRIPARYTDRAKRIAPGRFQDYSRLSVVSRVAAPSVPDDSSFAQPQNPKRTRWDRSPKPFARIRIQSNPSSTTFEVGAARHSPVRIERYTDWRWVDGRYTPFTVVTRDDEVITEIRLR